MRRVVFVGPTIGAEAVRGVLPDAEICPPARAGDIYAAGLQGADAIGLIDGYFDGVPSVWHKEVLWALKRGLPVFGASSMGALRAAELHSFGMIGVGAIFEAYADGTFEDDDEVALRHGPAELGYVALSEPMVNIRATLDHAVATGVLAPKIAEELIQRAKALFFPERSWARVLEGAARDGLAVEADAVQAWVRAQGVDQKREDALALLAVMARLPAQGMTPPHAEFAFQHSVAWEALTRVIKRRPPDREVALIFDLVRGNPRAYQDLRHRAAQRMRPQTPIAVPPQAVRAALGRFRAEHRLYSKAALEAWLEDQGTDLESLQEELAADLALVAAVAEAPMAFRAAVLETLQAEGDYGGLLAEAQAQARRLDAAGLPDPAPQDLDIPPAALLIWFFETLCEAPVPDDLDAYLAHHDFVDLAEFERAMARHYLLWHVLKETQIAASDT